MRDGLPCEAGSSRFLRVVAAREFGEGLAEEDAPRAVPLGAARAAGAGDRLGSLTPGKRADVVVWTGDPFSVLSRAEVILVGGRRSGD